MARALPVLHVFSQVAALSAKASITSHAPPKNNLDHSTTNTTNCQRECHNVQVGLWVALSDAVENRLRVESYLV